MGQNILRKLFLKKKIDQRMVEELYIPNENYGKIKKRDREIFFLSKKTKKSR